MSIIGCTIAALAMVGTLIAQSDPVLNCRKQAARLTNSTVADINGQRRGGLYNGNDIIVWKAKLSNNHPITGFCEASPQTGRIVRLEADQGSGDVNRSFRLTPGDAERVCAGEARARFSPGNSLIDAVFLPNTSTKSTYRFEWHYDSIGGMIRKGHCEIDSATGHLREFSANSGW